MYLNVFFPYRNFLINLLQVLLSIHIWKLIQAYSRVEQTVLFGEDAVIPCPRNPDGDDYYWYDVPDVDSDAVDYDPDDVPPATSQRVHAINQLNAYYVNLGDALVNHYHVYTPDYSTPDVSSSGDLTISGATWSDERHYLCFDLTRLDVIVDLTVTLPVTSDNATLIPASISTLPQDQHSILLELSRTKPRVLSADISCTVGDMDVDIPVPENDTHIVHSDRTIYTYTQTWGLTVTVGSNFSDNLQCTYTPTDTLLATVNFAPAEAALNPDGECTGGSDSLVQAYTCMWQCTIASTDDQQNTVNVSDRTGCQLQTYDITLPDDRHTDTDHLSCQCKLCNSNGSESEWSAAEDLPITANPGEISTPDPPPVKDSGFKSWYWAFIVLGIIVVVFCVGLVVYHCCIKGKSNNNKVEDSERAERNQRQKPNDIEMHNDDEVEEPEGDSEEEEGMRGGAAIVVNENEKDKQKSKTKKDKKTDSKQEKRKKKKQKKDKKGEKGKEPNDEQPQYVNQGSYIHDENADENNVTDDASHDQAVPNVSGKDKPPRTLPPIKHTPMQNL